MAGALGHISLLSALVLAALTAFAYYQTVCSRETSWLRYARTALTLHSLAVFTTLGCLLYLIFNHRYEYQYVWQHSSNELPFYFLISCLWEGQEGSFLLWICWNAIIGLILATRSKEWEPAVLMIFMTFQFLLITMVAGVIFPAIDWKIGSSPFLLLNEPLQTLIPIEGNGLNPLLQNLWMVIHPPIIFLGYALVAVPFAYCLAGLVLGLWTTWMRPAFPWLLASAALLGTGIVMGAYWAYETLNFGGYWNWDPVENAVYVPWLIIVAAAHAYSIFRKRKKGLASAVLLTLISFLAILYSTFLTRSGVLGDASVHAFTDLGLSGQLIFVLLLAMGGSIIILSLRWRKLPLEKKEPELWSLEFWMFVAIAVLSLAAFQVIIPTSIPVFNQLASVFGFNANLAPPADQVQFYTRFQLWFAVAFGILSAIGQGIHWKRSKAGIEASLALPIVISLVSSAVIILLSGINDWRYIVLLTTCIFALAVCLQILTRLWRQLKNVNIGGLLAHIGMAILLIGVLYSSGRSIVLSRHLTFDTQGSGEHRWTDHLMLVQGQKKEIAGLTVRYDGKRLWLPEHHLYADVEALLPTTVSSQRIAAKAVLKGNRVIISSGDTVLTEPENMYYQVTMEADGAHHILYPRMQTNPEMGFIASPAIQKSISNDIYSHVTNFPDPEKQTWTDPVRFECAPGDTLRTHGMLIRLNKIEEGTVTGVPLTAGDIPLRAHFRISDEATGREYDAYSLYLIRNGRVRLYPDHITAAGLKVWLEHIDPEKGRFKVATSFSQRDWITLQMIRFPQINLVWIGATLMIFGFLISLRYHLVKNGGHLKRPEHGKSNILVSNQHGKVIFYEDQQT